MSDLGWLLNDLVERVSAVEHGIMLSSDGLCMASSKGLSRDDGEHLAAVAAGLQSLANGIGERLEAGAVQQTVVEFKSRFLIVTAAGQGSRLAVVCLQDADIGLVAYEMAMLVARVGTVITASPRSSDPGR